MAYLGIINGELKGVYHFTSLAMAEDIRTQIKGCTFYLDKEKDKAMSDFSISENEILNGRILMDKYRNSENEMAYASIEGTPFDGVYCFKKKSVRDKATSKFEHVYWSMSKDEMLKKYNISESEIRDGGFLMSAEVKEYLKRTVNTEKNNQSTKDLDAVLPTSAVRVDNDAFRKMMSTVGQKHDVAEITMVTGDKYRIALRKVFLAEKDCDFSKCGEVSSDGTIVVKENAIRDMIKSGRIISVDKTRYECHNGFVTLCDCDDEYSPNFSRDENGNAVISHHFSEMIINMNQIVSVIGQNGYPEINLSHISPDKNKLIHTYLTKTF
jgi:hypothetical protein